MANNDLILLDQLLEQRMQEAGTGLSSDEFFEMFSAEQVLKDSDLSYDELSAGIVDGGNDGGIDSVYFFVNDSLYVDELDAAGLKRNVCLRLVLIQSKRSPGFSETALEKLISSARDLFDLSKTDVELGTVYNNALMEKFSAFRATYLNLASKFPAIRIEYVYASRGSEVHPNVERKVGCLTETIESLLKPVEVSFNFMTPANLLERARLGPSTARRLRLAENPISTGAQGYVCLVRLSDYFDFITDDGKRINNNLFESNVRDYQGKTEVNSEIRTTLDAPGDEDFWWLNNGVSIVCSKASFSAKELEIRDAEIVNGLQSSREIFNALAGKDRSKETRHVLVRVLTPESPASRDRIIKATNSQTPIPHASLRATDKIHRDIEEYLSARGYFYDRRKNYYKNQGRPIRRILSIPFLAQCVMTCALNAPDSARARPSSLIKSDDAYCKIFNQSYPLDLYIKCPLIVRYIEDVLQQSGNEDYRTHKSNILFYVANLWVLRHLGTTKPTIDKVAAIDMTTLTVDSVLEAAETVWQHYMSYGSTDQAAKGPDLVKCIHSSYATPITDAS